MRAAMEVPDRPPEACSGCSGYIPGHMVFASLSARRISRKISKLPQMRAAGTIPVPGDCRAERVAVLPSRSSGSAPYVPDKAVSAGDSLSPRRFLFSPTSSRCHGLSVSRLVSKSFGWLGAGLENWSGKKGFCGLKISRSESRKGRLSGGSVSASQTQRFGSNTSFSPSLTAQTPSDSPYPVFGRHEGHGVNHLTRGIPGPCRRQPIRKWPV